MLHVLCAEGNILGLFMFFCFIFWFYFYFRWSYGIVMWEIATLGKIPTSTYFFACVAFSLEREGGGWGPFFPHSPRALYPPLLSPTTRTSQYLQATYAPSSLTSV